MIPFRTTPEQILRLAAIILKMEKAGVDRTFIVEADELARRDQGVFDLMELWAAAAHDRAEREELIADIQESIDDYRDAPALPQQRPYIRYGQLSDVAKRVMAEKAKLRKLIDKHGGISAVAKKSGIPQPSLSRMLSSPSIPRRSTLYKIANALDLSEKEIAFEWTR